MCLIIDRPAYSHINSDLLASGLDDNPNGWGIMAGMGEDIHIVRGLDPRAFWDAYEEFRDVACTIHFRWTTHGLTCLENTHPFTICGGEYAVMHNGVIDVPIVDEHRSDTYHFCVNVLEPMLSKSPAFFESPKFRKWVEKKVGKGNKLVIMRADGQRVFVNRHMGYDIGDLWLSNLNSMPIEATGERWGRWDLQDLVDAFDETEIAEYCRDFPEEMARLISDHFDRAYFEARKDYR